MTYSFGDQRSRGEAAEKLLDHFFEAEYDITVATAEQQRLGIDRVYCNRATREVLHIEYKSDWTAGRTGNAFLETISVDRVGKPGWIHTSQADYIYYFIPDRGIVYIIELTKLRHCYSFWLRSQRKAPPVPNQGYHTHGILVPLQQLESCAERVVNIN